MRLIFVAALIACAQADAPEPQLLVQTGTEAATEAKPANSQFFNPLLGYGAFPLLAAGGVAAATMGGGMPGMGSPMPQPMQLPGMNMAQQGAPSMGLGQMGMPQMGGMPGMGGMSGMPGMGMPQMGQMGGAPQGMPMPQMGQMGQMGMGGMGGAPQGMLGLGQMGMPGMGQAGAPQMNMMGMPNMGQMGMPMGAMGPQGMHMPNLMQSGGSSIFQNGMMPSLMQSGMPNNDASINHMLLQSQTGAQAGAGANAQFYGAAAASPLAVGAGLTAFALNPYLVGAMAPYMLLGGLF